MHWVDRGDEPSNLVHYRSRYTPRWVKYYRMGCGKEPTDSYWRCFRESLESAFHWLCGYCELPVVNGPVDHFRPKSRFPEVVYCWPNWVLACSSCNNKKSSKWPEDGYVNPCALLTDEQPEEYFEFNLVSGEILPKSGLDIRRRNQAQRTIDDLHLNEVGHLKTRLRWLEKIEAAIPEESANLPSKVTLRELVTARSSQLSSITRTWLSQHR